MKLVLCPKCSDIVKFGQRRRRYCRCRQSWGKYTDDIHGQIGGLGIPVCLANSSLVEAIRNQPDDGFYGERFDAWVPPKQCDTIERIDNGHSTNTKESSRKEPDSRSGNHNMERNTTRKAKDYGSNARKALKRSFQRYE